MKPSRIVAGLAFVLLGAAAPLRAGESGVSLEREEMEGPDGSKAHPSERFGVLKLVQGQKTEYRKVPAASLAEEKKGLLERNRREIEAWEKEAEALKKDRARPGRIPAALKPEVLKVSTVKTGLQEAAAGEIVQSLQAKADAAYAVLRVSRATQKASGGCAPEVSWEVTYEAVRLNEIRAREEALYGDMVEKVNACSGLLVQPPPLPKVEVLKAGIGEAEASKLAQELTTGKS